MAILKLIRKTGGSIVEIISFNIDDQNEVLIKEEGELCAISLETFKEMAIGTKTGKEATYKIIE